MLDRDTILATIESAEQAVPLCTVCGEPTVLNADADGTVWLECSALSKPQSTPRWLLTVMFPHVRRPVLLAA
jgi:hypothetical protein